LERIAWKLAGTFRKKGVLEWEDDRAWLWTAQGVQRVAWNLTGTFQRRRESESSEVDRIGLELDGNFPQRNGETFHKETGIMERRGLLGT
jgi:hypothetical protein